MADKQRIDSIADRLAEEYVTDAGDTVERDHVAEVVAAAAETLDGAPVQDFVPLLVENAVRDRLHEEGLHAEPADEDTAPPQYDGAGDDDRLASGYAQADVETPR
jgi:hypothetical protein